ncbi:radical SAM protein [Candidatus Gottesmanbacteria bacterium]|nr:radical SAM protein [Candidatus Gottesmanbacteria bacterium]
MPASNFSAPDTVFFEVTRACNLRCVHCLNNSGYKLKDELPYLKRLQIIQDLADSGVQEIRFTGGEPMTSPRIHELLNAAHERGMRISMGTNAMLISRDEAAILAQQGVRFAVVSLDGTPVIHDRIRGAETFRKTMKGTENLRAAGIAVRINAVVMRSNLSDLPQLVDMIYRLEIPIFLRRLIPSGRADHQEMLNAQEYAQLRKFLADYLSDPRGLVQGHYLAQRDHTPRISLPFQRRDCSAGQRGMVILPNGKVQTCGFLGPMGETYVGTVPAEHFADVWQRLCNSDHIPCLQSLLPEFNRTTNGPKTNCLAMALFQKTAKQGGRT